MWALDGASAISAESLERCDREQVEMYGELVILGVAASALSVVVYAILRHWRSAVRLEVSRARRASEMIPSGLRRILYGGSSLSPQYHAVKLGVMVGIAALVAICFWLAFLASLTEVVSGGGGVVRARPHAQPGSFAVTVAVSLAAWGVGTTLLLKRDSAAKYLWLVAAGALRTAEVTPSRYDQAPAVRPPGRYRRMVIGLAIGQFLLGVVFLLFGVAEFL